MATNILALPIAHLTIEASKNEDWVDTLLYIAGQDGPQLDLRGIAFDMQIRRRADDPEVIVNVSSTDPSSSSGSVHVGSPPDVGYLILHVPRQVMMYLFAGQYVGDIVAHDGQWERRCLTFDLSIIEGVTRTK